MLVRLTKRRKYMAQRSPSTTPGGESNRLRIVSLFDLLDTPMPNRHLPPPCGEVGEPLARQRKGEPAFAKAPADLVGQVPPAEAFCVGWPGGGSGRRAKQFVS